MRWAKTVRHQASIEEEGEIYNILCESDFDEFAVYINGEYVGDEKELPTRERLLHHINKFEELSLIESEI